MSADAIGHTGFTGTSLWIDRARDLYVVLLTNRIHPTRANDAHIAFRPDVHDAILTAFDARLRRP
jgi:CubicO group peptidase (beta-lactamase class C family)